MEVLKGDEEASKGFRHFRSTQQGGVKMQQRGAKNDEAVLKRDNKAVKGNGKVLSYRKVVSPKRR